MQYYSRDNFYSISSYTVCKFILEKGLFMGCFSFKKGNKYHPI